MLGVSRQHAASAGASVLERAGRDLTAHFVDDFNQR
jgi:hypothetical protein